MTTPKPDTADLRAFLESAPLYKAISRPLGRDDAKPSYPDAITRPCKPCKTKTTWAREYPVGEASDFGGGDLLSFACVLCREERVLFWVLAEGTEMQPREIMIGRTPKTLNRPTSFRFRKIGQWEAWDVRIDRDVEKALDPADAELYKKGLLNLSQSCGLGAVAYFRRVVENETYRLLDIANDAALAANDEAAQTAIASARKGHNADERLRLAAAAAPHSLIFAGINPFKALYDQFSAALHAKTEDECTDVAIKLRAAFEYVFKTVRGQLREAEQTRKTLSGG